jgi:hypothetical protein
MTELLTRVAIPEIPLKVNYTSSFFLMGSCFADSIGMRMTDLKFRVCYNPFGVIYNPLSIASNLKLLAEKERFTKNELSFHNELWFSFKHYTLFSDPDPDRCLEKINAGFEYARNFISRANVLILTLGTSWAFELKETGRIVANCHKLPAAKFHRLFSSVENSTEHLKEAILKIREKNPALDVILTVSPVRHWKDGAVENQRSKAALILTAANLQQELENVYYFPVYEIFMDELRDYRFYGADMLHPSDVAIEYIWQKFAASMLSREVFPIIKSVEDILMSIKHKARNPHTAAYGKFRDELLKKILHLKSTYPFLNFQKEMDLLTNSV